MKVGWIWEHNTEQDFLRYNHMFGGLVTSDIACQSHHQGIDAPAIAC